MIRDRNIDPTASFPIQIVTLQLTVGASHADAAVAAAYVPYRSKLVSAKFYAASVTDADDSIKVKLLDDAVELMADTDPVASATVLTATLTGKDDIAAGSWIIAHATTGAGDALDGTWTLQLRPYLGATERIAKSLV